MLYPLKCYLDKHLNTLVHRCFRKLDHIPLNLLLTDVFLLAAAPCCVRPAFTTVQSQLLDIWQHIYMGPNAMAVNVTAVYDWKEVISNSVGAIQERGD